MKSINYVILIILLFGSCKTAKSFKKESNNTDDDLKTWYCKDFQKNNIPGISIDKYYEINDAKIRKTNIIVAVLDTQLDINHDDLKNQIWTNTLEIPNNYIDDDNNGYIDDIHGWNFTATKSGNYIVWGNFEYIRIIRRFDPFFKDKKKEDIVAKDTIAYKEYQKALKYFIRENKFYNNYLKSLQYSMAIYPLAKEKLKQYFPKEDYTYKQLDSMYAKYKSNDKSYKQRRDGGDDDFGALIADMQNNIELNTNSLEKLKDLQIQYDSILNKNANLNYNERLYIGDNPDVLEKGYGNNEICADIKDIRSMKDHSTEVSGIIAANRENDIGIKGFSNHIQIMPLVISTSGNENDKDIALAIRYAVDNGAKVINMSFGKEFSVHGEWVTEALKYAESKEVIVVHAAGNSGFNIDKIPDYPNDYNYDDKTESGHNFINVGSVSSKLDSTFVSGFSNYGKHNVDLFASGDDIYTTAPNNKYISDSGTSLAAPMVSGTAALIWLYYPDLKADEVKRIILDSGTAYDFEVLVPGGRGEKAKFSELSKSGKVLNVYNAMKMAKEYGKKIR